MGLLTSCELVVKAPSSSEVSVGERLVVVQIFEVKSNPRIRMDTHFKNGIKSGW